MSPTIPPVLGRLGLAIAVVLSMTAISAQIPNSRSAPLALVGGTIYISPTEEPVRNGVVLIEGERIAAVGPRARVRLPQEAQLIDCSGLTITAGFWNSHVHFFERKWADAGAIPVEELRRQIEEMLTRYGFTSVFELSSTWSNTRRLRDRIESGEVSGPRIRSAGEALIPRGALPPDAILNFMGLMKTPIREVVDPEQAASTARSLLDEGVNGIKLFASGGSGSLPQTVMEAAVHQAHRLGKPAFVHPETGADVVRALRSGVDVIAHTTPNSGDWDETVIAAIRERPVALTPTLTIWKYFARHDRISAQDRIVATELGQLRAWIAAGGTVLFGNDLGAVDYDPAEEYSLMASAGMSFTRILASLTAAPAERFGESKQLGRVETGFLADLVVLKSDPARNVRALASVQYTVRSGKIVYRSSE